MGNPLRSDDGIGWRIVQELRNRIDDSRIELIECQQLAPEMAELLGHIGLVVFVDAAAQDSPGEWRHDRLQAGGSSGAFSHGSTPEALLAMSADLYGAAPEAHLFTVSGSSFCYGENLSAKVRRAFPLVVAEIENLLRARETLTAAG
jgi:hydrogenase maturation protease